MNRLTIRTTVVQRSREKVIGGQEFEATGPRAPKTLRELLQKLSEQFYDPGMRYDLVIKQMGKEIGRISKDGAVFGPEGDPGRALECVPQNDPYMTDPQQYPKSNLYRFYRKENGGEWEAVALEVHTEESAQSRIRVLRAVMSEKTYQFHCRIIDL